MTMSVVKKSVWIVPYLEESGMILVAKRSSKTNNGGLWNFFGGGVDTGEKAINAAVREFREEAGIKIKARDLVYIGSTRLTTLRTRYKMVYYRLDVASHLQPKLNNENSDAKWVSLNRLDKMQKIHHSIRGFRRYLDEMLRTKHLAALKSNCHCVAEGPDSARKLKIYYKTKPIAVARLLNDHTISGFRTHSFFKKYAHDLAQFMVNEAGISNVVQIGHESSPNFDRMGFSRVTSSSTENFKMYRKTGDRDVRPKI